MTDYTQVDAVFANAGLNLRDTPDTLQPGQFRRLTNVRSLAEGSLTTRPGRQFVAGFRDGNEVHTLTKLGRAIISGSGTRVYRNGAAYPTEFSGAPLSFAKHRASDSDEKWLYVTDGTQFRMLAEDLSDIKWGITALNEKPVAVQTTETGLLDSSVPGAIVYDWRIVYKNSRTGGKSNPTPVHDGIAVVGKKAKIITKSSLDGQVDTVEFYRRGGVNIDTWRLVGSSPNRGLDPATNVPLPVEFVDNIPDSEAAQGFEIRLDNDVPFTSVDSQGNAVLEAPLPYVWGPLNGQYLFSCGDPNRQGDVYWTNPGRPHSAAAANHISVTGPDEPLIGGFIHGGLSYVWSRENLYALDFQGETATPTFLPRKTFVGRGLSLPFAFATGPLVWFFSKDGIYATDGQSPAEPYSETTIRPLFNPQVEDRQYVAPGALGVIAWPPYAIFTNTTRDFTDEEDAQRDFVVSLNTSSMNVLVGGTTTAIATVTADTVFFHDVELSVVGLPVGASYSFTPVTGVPGTQFFNSSLAITAGPGTVAGTYSIQIKAQRVGGSINHLTDPVSLVIVAATPPTPTGSFGLALSPTTVACARAANAAVAALISSTAPFSSPVTLSAGTLPAGVTVAFNPGVVTPPSGSVAQSQVRFFLSSAAIIGDASITITGTASDGTTQSASVLLSIVAEPGDPTAREQSIGLLRMVYGGQELHIHYKDVLGQWVHLRNHLPYGRWSNDESPEVTGGLGTIYEPLSYFDEEQANTSLLVGTNLGLVGLETGTYDWVPGKKIQCRVREGSNTLGLPQTIKEFGNVLLDADCGDAVLPLSINPAQPSGISIVPFLDAETRQLSYQRIAGTGRQKFPRALKDSNGGQPVYGYSCAIDIEWNGNATIYGKTLQVHPEEEVVTNWAFGPTSHGLRGYQTVKDLYLMVKCGTPGATTTLTATVIIDGVTYPLYDQNLSTSFTVGDFKTKVHLYAPPVKGKTYRWQVVGQRFMLYGNECEVRVKEIASGLSYNLVAPFQGGTGEV